MKWQNKVNLSPPSSSPNHSSISLIKDTPGCLVGINLKWQSGSASGPGMEAFLVLIKGRHSVYAPAWNGSEEYLIRKQQVFSSLGGRVEKYIPSPATVVNLVGRTQQANRSFRLPWSIEQRPNISLVINIYFLLPFPAIPSGHIWVLSNWVYRNSALTLISVTASLIELCSGWKISGSFLYHLQQGFQECRAENTQREIDTFGSSV